ncbi:conserved hypothetical protein [uncultured Mycobacterium sp.]|uniref:HTH tetR-type domain-containing protein n=1 Tax=uncultured Mycobacterium sp. TaxID=171292 RepID=A0A1Y5PKD9_9MYCO|nr:conserved hypothetical protein [uncultured Mycobacterium sp.]
MDSAPEDQVRRRRPGGGRRRDPDIDTRVLHAARQAYAEFGWAGFHFDRVAKSARVSRDVLYRRYSDKASLLLDALADAVLPTVHGGGPIRDQLMTYAREMHSYFTSADGVASLRIHLEAAQFPDLYRAYRDRVVDPNFVVNIAALNRAAAGGHLRKTADPTAVLEAIGGGVLIHALFSQHAGATKAASQQGRKRLEAALASFVELALADENDA